MMFLVYFRGHGEWFIHDSNTLKLAIKRTTPSPYIDRSQIKIDPDHYIAQKDTNEYKHDYYLDGIFVRNPDISG